MSTKNLISEQKNMKKKISDFTPDPGNANLGTERGRALLENSLRQYGAGRSILVDKNGVVIAGNKTLETAAEIGFEDVEVIRTDGKHIVAVQRMDLDLSTDPEARALAYADNRISEIDYSLDLDVLLRDAKEIDLSGLWSEDELNMLFLNTQIPEENKDIDEEAMKETEHECPKCGFKW